MKQPIKIGITFTKSLEGWEDFYKQFNKDILEKQDPSSPTSILNYLYWEKASKQISKPFRVDDEGVIYTYTRLFKSATPGVRTESMIFKHQLQTAIIEEILEDIDEKQYDFWIDSIKNSVGHLNGWYKDNCEKYRKIAFELYDPEQHLFYCTLLPGSEAVLRPCEIITNVKGRVKLYQVMRYQLGKNSVVYKREKEVCIGENVNVFEKIEEMKLRAKEHSLLRAEYYSRNIVLEGGVVLPKDIFNIILKCV